MSMDHHLALYTSASSPHHHHNDPLIDWNAKESFELSMDAVKPPPRQKINARERYRTLNVNAAYKALRGLIPTKPINRKLSKIEIIQLASSYITHLRTTLYMGTANNPCTLQREICENSTGTTTTTGVPRVNSICTFCLKQTTTTAE